jgi:hypothetical protein
MLALLFAAIPIAAGCGSSGGKHAQPATTTATTQSTASAPATTAAASPSALQAEATSAAAGDIPDNQVYLVFHNTRSGYSMRYPEGWAQSGAAATTTIRDKNNIVRVVVGQGPPATTASARRDVAALTGAKLSNAPRPISLPSGRAIKVAYTTVSAPNAVTGKRVTLSVDRYYLAHAGKRAVVDLGSPVGVDNVDAYKAIIQSFRWR